MLLDIAPFAKQTATPDLVFRWEEPRNISCVHIRFAPRRLSSCLPQVFLSYWQSKWPDTRPSHEDLARGRIGRAAWKQQDDWFNGVWRPADVESVRQGNRLIITFGPLARKEFPQLRDYNVTFRRTLQLKIAFQDPKPRVDRVRIFTDSVVERRRIAIQLGCGKHEKPCEWNSKVEVYNGYVKQVRKPTYRDPRLLLTLLCSRPAAFSHDATVVTVRSPSASFSFRPDDLLSAGSIWAPELGVLITPAEANIRYSPRYVEGLCTCRSIYDRIPDVPEQSLGGALREQPPKRPMHFVVGIEGGRQKFGVEPNGDIFADIGYVRKVPGPDTARVSWRGKRLYVRFHLDDLTPNGRFLEEGYLPLLRSTFSRGPLDVCQEVFATKLLGGIRSKPTSGDDPVLAMVRLTFVNRGDGILQVKQRVGLESGDPPSKEAVSIRQMLVYAGDNCSLRMAVAVCEGADLSSWQGDLVCRFTLAPGGSRSIVFKIPFTEPGTAEEISSLEAKDWDAEWRDVKEFWKDRVGSGTEIHTGESDLDDFYKAHLTHILINDDHEVGSNRIMARVSSFRYGCFPNESIMQIMELDRRGFHEEARRRLDVFLHYQGTVALPGNFKTKEGVFYGSGGYECGGYNQHHGWVLWGLAEHFRYTGDSQWLLGIAGKLVAGCDWVIRERKSTMVPECNGRKALEHGFLPAGSLEDVREFCYWFSTNCLSYRGLAAAARVLQEVGHPDGNRLAAEAEGYLADLLRGIEESMIRSPLVRLRNGSFVPHVPSRLYWRGRDLGWIREVLEGSINLVGTVLSPDDPKSTWIMKDYEDNRYLDWPFSYPLGDFEAQWFSLGGFSMQPNLVYTVSPYLVRDQVEHFLRGFFNSFAACWRADIRCLTEHPLPTLADWGGDHFKTSDESNAAFSLRLMFIQETGKDLFLGRALPRRWLAGGRRVWIRKAHTHFGPMDLEIAVSADAGSIVATIDPPTRYPPRRIFLRLRHPDRKPMRAVRVNGQPWENFDPNGELVILHTLSARTVVSVLYGRRDGSPT